MYPHAGMLKNTQCVHTAQTTFSIVIRDRCCPLEWLETAIFAFKCHPRNASELCRCVLWCMKCSVCVLRHSLCVCMTRTPQVPFGRCVWLSLMCVPSWWRSCASWICSKMLRASPLQSSSLWPCGYACSHLLYFAKQEMACGL
jgi:hypothetical protein